MTVTTVKVPVGVRDRLKKSAERDGRSLGAQIEYLLAREERRLRLDEAKAAIRETSKEQLEDYWAETSEWLDADLA